MLQTIERYMKQAIVERNAAVSSAALTSSLHLTRIANDVVKRWVNEAQEAVNSDKYVYQNISCLQTLIYSWLWNDLESSIKSNYSGTSYLKHFSNTQWISINWTYVYIP